MTYLVPTTVLLTPLHMFFDVSYICFSDVPFDPGHKGVSYFVNTRKDQDGIPDHSIISMDGCWNPPEEVLGLYLDLAHEQELRGDARAYENFTDEMNKALEEAYPG